MRKTRFLIFFICMATLAGVSCYLLINSKIIPKSFTNIIQKQYYSAEDFDIKTIHSKVDFNKNGVDDYRDIMLGARKDAENHPAYKSTYYKGGYPPSNEGVCTDVVWRAFKNAGYCLRDMVDKDIRANKDLYFKNGEKPDANIDFRRVPNLMTYFGRKAVSLTLNTKKISQFQPGDIVTYKNSHIAVISERRNSKGVPFIIHNNGQLNREENGLEWSKISGHYRFDASRLNKSELIKFK